MNIHSPFALYVLFFCGVLLHYFASFSDAFIFQILRLIIGLITLILIPGLFIVNLIRYEIFSNIAFALIFGFMLQLLNVFGIWWFYTISGGMNFTYLLYLATGVFTFVLMVVSVKRRVEIGYNFMLKKDVFLAIPIILCVCIVLFYPGLGSAFHSDGGAYLDLARNVVTNNVFSSHMIDSPNSWAQVQWSTGMVDHFFGYSAIAVFFALSGVSLLTAKFMLLFVGCLALFPLYIISEKLFNRRVAWIAASLTAISPIILYHLALVGGPDIVSLLFVLTTLCLMLVALGAKLSKARFYILSGTTLFVAWYAWLLNGYILILYLPLLYMFFSSKFNRKSLKSGILPLLLLVFCFFFDYLIVGHFTYRFIGFPFPAASAVMLLILYRFNRKLMLPKTFLVFLATSILLVFLASYVPRLISAPFVQFDAQKFPTAQVQVGANAEQTINIITQAFNIERVKNFASWYLMGKSFSWDGLFNTFGILTIFLAVASLARVNKLKETLIVLSFPLIHLILWVLMSPTDVVQPRYLLGVAPFYFILAASTIDVILSYSKSSRIYVLKIRFIRASSSFNLNKILVGLLLFSAIIAFWQPVYANISQNVNYWDMREKYNWGEAIDWINSHASSSDVIATVYADCFVWYIDKPTVFMYHINGSANMSTLIALIRASKVNYLVVDQPFAWQFANLEDLYASPNPFLGSTIVFMNKDSEKGNVIIYNVTNIAYGSLTKIETKLSWSHLENWQPLTYYSKGNISSNQSAVKFDLTVADTPWPSGASTFTFSLPANLTQYSSVKFSIMTQKSNKIVLEIYSGLQGQNYLSYVRTEYESNKWVDVIFDLETPYNTVGQPNLQDVTKMNFIVGGFSAGQNVTFLIKDITFYLETYA
jgi:hypothetical protein